MGNEQFTNRMREYFTVERAEAKKTLEDPPQERLEIIQGLWQVFRTHAVPQGLCENVIKLLANQQRDGDSSIPVIVTGLRKKKKRENVLRTV